MLRVPCQVIGVFVSVLLTQSALGSPDNPFSGICTLKNTFHNEFLYAGGDSSIRNGNRQVYTWVPGSKKGNWQFEPVDVNSNLYRIKSADYPEYLDATEAFDSDKDKTRVHTTSAEGGSVESPENKCSNCWTLKSLDRKGNNFLVQHSELKGYMYAAGDAFKEDSDQRRVFVGKPPSSPGKPIRNGKWLIKCG